MNLFTYTDRHAVKILFPISSCYPAPDPPKHRYPLLMIYSDISTDNSYLFPAHFLPKGSILFCPFVLFYTSHYLLEIISYQDRDLPNFFFYNVLWFWWKTLPFSAQTGSRDWIASLKCPAGGYGSEGLAESHTPTSQVF